MIGREDETREYRDRIKFYLLGFFAAFVLLAVRMFYLQGLKGSELRRFSEANRLKQERIFPARGRILDRESKVIVDNRASFDAVLLSQYYDFKPETDTRLASVLGLPVEDLSKKLGKIRRGPRFLAGLLKSDVSKDMIAGIEIDPLGFRGVDIEATVMRTYPYYELSSQWLGYVGEVTKKDLNQDKSEQLRQGDYIGKIGLERLYDSYLRGINGVGYVEVDAMGRRRQKEFGEQVLGFIAYTDPVPGNDLVLTIDLDLSLTALNALKRRNFHGSIVALDPRSGAILTMVNYPSYNPEDISRREVSPKVWEQLANDVFRPLRNRAIQDHYPPGSTFKLIVAIGGLAEGVVNDAHKETCTGSILYGGRVVHCWKHHGVVDLYRAIRESCDVYFYRLGLKLGVDNIAKYARMFGFGDRTGLKLSSETSGLIPDSQWKLKNLKEPWQLGETLSVAIGQGFVSSTPLQLALGFGAIANEGFVYRPYIVQKIMGLGGVVLKQFEPELINKVNVPPEVLRQVKEGLFQVVNNPQGTAYGRGRSKKVLIAGKTGTSQVRRFADIKVHKCEDLPWNERHHGLFVGYAPAEAPEIVVSAVGEHICKSADAAEMVKEVIEIFMKKKGLKDVEEGRTVASQKEVTPQLVGEAKEKTSEKVDESREETIGGFIETTGEKH